MLCASRSKTSTMERKVISTYFEDDDEADTKMTRSISDRPNTDCLVVPFSLVKSITQTGTLGLIMEREEMQSTLLGGGTKNNSLIETVQAMERRRERKDRRGKPIKKGLKQHRITFKDEVIPGESLAQVVLVESYKQFNVDMSTRPSQKCCRVL